MSQSKPVEITEDVMADQRQRLVDEYDLNEDEAEQVFRDVKTEVMMMAQSADRSWNKSEYEAVTDVLMGIQYKQMEMMKEIEDSALTTLKRYLSLMLMMLVVSGFFIAFWSLVSKGPTAPNIFLAIISMILIGFAVEQ